MNLEKPTILVCDIDGTLLSEWSNPNAGNEALKHLTIDLFGARAAREKPLLFGTGTGRVLSDHQQLEADNGAFWMATAIMDFKITGVGSEVSFRNDTDFAQDPAWPNAPGWDFNALQELLSERSELDIQSEDALGTHKLSFNVTGVSNDRHAEYTAERAKQIADANLSAEVIFSMGQYLDLLPEGVHKGSALEYVVERLIMPSTTEVFRIAAGDTMNDIQMLATADLAILPSNADNMVQEWVKGEGNIRGQFYIAGQPYAAGIHEGLQVHGIL